MVAPSIAAVVENGLCIGCGLCESVTNGRVPMELATIGSMRPSSTVDFRPDEEAKLLAACPGVSVGPRQHLDVPVDPIWGAHGTMRLGWAADPTVRFEAATGGVLTALGMYLVASRQVSFVLHVGQDAGDGFTNGWRISETAEGVFAGKGSRYGPVSALAGLETALRRDEPFALIAKPCDAAAVHSLGAVDERVERLCTHRMVMVCGGQSRVSKSIGAAAGFGLDPDQVDSIRYRGFGNPGPTVITDRSGNAHALSYLDMWADEGTWDLDSRCTVCPDPLGEAADISASDAWPGGAPTGEDEGFNGVVAYSEVGERLLADAVADGYLVLGDQITPREFDDLQPHQVRKKEALAARFEALAAADKPVLRTAGLRVEEIGARLDGPAREREIEGTAVRIARGRYEA
ncbi:MAG: Coenzyme F420 hydrogenase/dehydrogenase, beta subunit C-terminal domain [Actinomycetota bacterium]